MAGSGPPFETPRRRRMPALVKILTLAAWIGLAALVVWWLVSAI